MTDDISLNDLRQGNYWDSVRFDEMRGFSRRLFGNSNVGNLDRCNLQVPGQIGNFDASFVIQRWYARTSISPDLIRTYSVLMHWAQRTYVHLVMGDKPQWMLPLYELFERRPRTTDADSASPRRFSRDPWPLLVPVRQNISVTIDSFDSAGLEHLGYDGHAQGELVWIHVEGVSLPPITR